MNKIVLRDLEASRELDRQAMAAIMGSGLWGSIKKYSRKVSRSAIGQAFKAEINSKYRSIKNALSYAGWASKTTYYGFRGIIRRYR